MDHFDLHAPFSPTGDQPEAIAKLVQGIRDGDFTGRYRFR